MKTYAESNNKTPFDWNTFLKNAIRRKSEMPDEDHDNAIKLSGEWVTCACGNQCDILERDERGEPLDEELMELGSYFHDYICYKDWKEAIETL